ncbi:hypothetical protein HELRODRAFT_88492 [Helobdella robusta]|uniref:DNA replication complex GINS protein PSF1 n=1 Tax=Helobdella robusta TaxID=6412 RepID=T1G733_HELRO|nr:hypothetical protein HELRODRAFT_88492 [Helobdella robusta]ESN93628.1 hypothetical protein HELRODRAFT_88492 [Helobdella robusta]
MFGEKALELVKELQRAQGKSLPLYNNDLIKNVLDEMKILFEQNQEDLTMAGQKEYYPAIQMRHAALERNKRCLLAYLYNRISILRQMRWDIGSVLPLEIKSNLSEHEIQWFTKYNRMLATYMRCIGDHGGLDLTQDTKPPKSLYIEVRCLQDHGEFETQDGNTILLSKNSQHFMMRSECEQMIRQGILEHIID